MRVRLLFVALAALVLAAAWVLRPPMWVYPSAFAVMFLFYANTFWERVPLYLSNRTTASALALILDGGQGITLPRTSPRRRPIFVDLGCGLGGLLSHLARVQSDWDFVGVETAPGPYVIAKIRTAFLPNVQVRYQSLWKTDLAPFDVVYAFLSPAPMPRLHAKAACEMRPESLFISNSFWADDQDFDGIVEVNDARSTRLFYVKI